MKLIERNYSHYTHILAKLINYDFHKLSYNNKNFSLTIHPTNKINYIKKLHKNLNTNISG